MKRSLFSRLLAACLCLCMLPGLALAYNGDDTPVTRSDFSVRLTLQPDAFPDDGAAHYVDWAKFLEQISLRGVADTQHFLMPLNRVYFDGGLYLNDQLTVPFLYDSYITFRYLRSPALAGASVHFQMNNFFQFMMKGYYFLGLPTQLIALPMYPEAAVDLALMYREAVGDTFEGRGSRKVSYNKLLKMCRRMDQIVQEDLNDRSYYFWTCLLGDMGVSDIALDRLGAVEDVLQTMDPKAKGLSITVDGDAERWTLGGTTVLEKDENGLWVQLSDSEGYTYSVSLRKAEEEANALLSVMLEDEVRLQLEISVEGLPQEGQLRGSGLAEVSLTGEALYDPIPDQQFLFSYDREREELPSAVQWAIDWVHPETGKAAIGVRFKAHQEEQPASVLIERDYDNQDDFFHLNESFMAEYKERFLPTLALAFTPFALRMPMGVMSDIIAFLNETGLLSVIGVE